MKYIIIILFSILYDYILFGITAIICGHACNKKCKNCKNWACTHGIEPKPKSFYPVKDWYKWCNLWS